jgi:hypothetical protein
MPARGRLGCLAAAAPRCICMPWQATSEGSMRWAHLDTGGHAPGPASLRLGSFTGCAVCTSWLAGRMMLARPPMQSRALTPAPLRWATRRRPRLARGLARCLAGPLAGRRRWQRPHRRPGMPEPWLQPASRRPYDWRRVTLLYAPVGCSFACNDVWSVCWVLGYGSLTLHVWSVVHVGRGAVMELAAAPAGSHPSPSMFGAKWCGARRCGGGGQGCCPLL